MGPIFRRSSGRQLSEQWFNSDIKFNRLYPGSVRLLSKRHWTPLIVAKIASNFLAVGRGAKILDIGSGVGKFCLAAGFHKPLANFYGVEQRAGLVRYANLARDRLGLSNVNFIHGNFTQVKFCEYDHFYFYNSFYENLVDVDRIDESVAYSEELYDYYTRYLYAQLLMRPAGTRLVTFHCLGESIPRSYQLVATELDHLLKCWIKE